MTKRIVILPIFVSLRFIWPEWPLTYIYFFLARPEWPLTYIFFFGHAPTCLLMDRFSKEILQMIRNLIPINLIR